jgi:hypothetical protein
MKIFFKLFFILMFLNLYSQGKYEYFGMVKLNGAKKAVITYRLVFSESNGSIKGYSVTDLGGNNETKNLITGSYNKKTKVISFNEEEILYTKSTFSDDMFCFINFTGKVKLSEKNTKLDGDFSGMYKNKKKCIDGSLLLIGSTKLYKLLDNINNKIQKSKKVDPAKKQIVNPLVVLDSLKVNNLIKNQNLNVFTKFDVLELEIWDAKREDGDVINLYNNEKLILSNFVIVNKRKKIMVNIENGKNVFKIVAVNEGEMEPNTAMIQLIDKDRTFELMSNLKKGESTSITIIKVKE